MTTTGLKGSRGSFAAMYDTSRQVSLDAGPRHMRLENLVPDPNQPRRQFFVESLEELASSIKVHGVLQPITVRPLNNSPGRYQIVAGERRFQAAKRAGLESVPVVIKELSDAESREVALIENLQRENIQPLEEAHVLQTMLESTGLTQREIGNRIGKSPTYVEQRIRLLRHPQEILSALQNAQTGFTPGHAKAVVQLEDAGLRSALITLVAQGLSVRETERRTHQLKRLQEAEAPEAQNRLKDSILKSQGLSDAAFEAALLRPNKPAASPQNVQGTVDLRELSLYQLFCEAQATGHWHVETSKLKKHLKADAARV